MLTLQLSVMQSFFLTKQDHKLVHKNRNKRKPLFHLINVSIYWPKLDIASN